MIPVSEAYQRLFGLISPVGSEIVSLSGAVGRRLAAPISARVCHPSTDVSAMDGYAVRAVDIATHNSLTVIGESAAGHPFSGHVGAGEAVRIFTGAELPHGADAIAIQEHVQTDTVGKIQLSQEGMSKLSTGTYIRYAGQDFKNGDCGLTTGVELGARQIALAAAMNHPWVEVFRKPRVACLSTGDELVWPGDPHSAKKTINSNSFGLVALAQSSGADVQQLVLSPDQDHILKRRIEEVATSVDLLVTSGGVSVGDHDRLRPVLEDCGCELEFWKIAMRPGKPLLVGQLGQTLVLGLPGNPVSALVCGLLFLLPALRRLQGVSAEDSMPQTLNAVSESDLPENDHRQDQLRARLTGETPDGTPKVRAYPKQDSGMLQTLAMSNGLIVRPPHAPAAKAGAQVEFIPFPACF